MASSCTHKSKKRGLEEYILKVFTKPGAAPVLVMKFETLAGSM
jgi:hypothetical protein